ncbi:hypothetical protein [uncultured Psychroserpens sp.]|uniref:hypothetical protein n=1 Tax=uncultured Psychroserpens sp. TaxID=255436 RepID=UPI002611391F|nr:hypothetical protein [uncultured Psychroserpens sp.]
MPLGESMISSLKSNKSITLDKTSRFKKTLGGYGRKKKVEFDFPEGNPQLLKQIRTKIKKDNKRTLIILTMLFILFFSGSILVIQYFNIV